MIQPGVLQIALSFCFCGASLAEAGSRPGTLLVWGDNDYGQANVPVGLNDFVAVSGGYQHTLALRSNSTVVAWGDNTYGQTNIPAGLSNVVALAAGYNHCLALQSNGTVVSWGWNGDGQANIPNGLSNVVAIAGGGAHSLALLSNGTVTAWGWNYFGQASVPAGLSNVVAVAAGDNHSLALQSNGMVVAWGWNESGQANVPAGLSNVVAVAGGGFHSLALTGNGTVVAWGDDTYGQVDVPAGLSNVIAIAGGDLHSLALQNNGTVVAWGWNGDGQASFPPVVSGALAIAGGGYHSLAIVPIGLNTGLVAYYPLNGAAGDGTGSGHDGFIQSATATTDRFGRVGQALLFDGTQSLVDVPDCAALRLAATDFTIAAWIFETQRNAAYQDCIVSKRGTNAADGWFLSIRGQQPDPSAGETGDLYYQVSGGQDPFCVSKVALSLNQWHHIALVYSNGTQTVQEFIDGVQDFTTSGLPSPSLNTTADLRIGGDSAAANNAYAFHGKIAEVRIYNRGLAASEVLALYTSGLFLTSSHADSTGISTTIGGVFAGETVVLQGSRNFAAWTALQTNISPGPTLSVTNPGPAFPVQFFRAAVTH